jgi:hypothetical protein
MSEWIKAGDKPICYPAWVQDVDGQIYISQNSEGLGCRHVAYWQPINVPKPLNEKCWMELNVEKFGFGSRGQKSVYMELGKDLVHEAIKRIEVLELELRKNSGHNIETVLTGAIRILKNLIGEKL